MNSKRLKTVLAVVLTVKLVVILLALALYMPGGPSGGGGPAKASAQEKGKASPATAAKGAAGGKTASSAGTPEAAKNAAASAGPAYDPQLLKLIEDKRQRLAIEEARLVRERRELAKLRAEVTARIADLKKVQSALEDLLRAEKAQRAARIAQLAKLIGNMKPAAAGAMIARLDDAMAVEIFKRMQARVAGKVMANLEPGKAARISVLLSGEGKTAGAAQLGRGAAQRGMQPPPKKEEKPPVVFPPEARKKQ